MTQVATFMIGAALSLGAAPSVSAQSIDPATIPLDADIVIMGEEHDAPDHHLNQAGWIERLAPTAVVFEMVPHDLSRDAEEVGTGDMRLLGRALMWEERGWPDFETYFPIFEAAGRARIYGAEVARDDLSDAVAQGAATVFEGDEAFGLDADLPKDMLATRIDMQDAAHCGLMPSQMLPGMVEAQRLRDAALAQSALDALDQTGGPVAVVTGNGHARTDWGVPALVAAARPDLGVVSIGQFAGSASPAPYDHVVVTDPPDGREGDPCDALR